MWEYKIQYYTAVGEKEKEVNSSFDDEAMPLKAYMEQCVRDMMMPEIIPFLPPFLTVNVGEGESV